MKKNFILERQSINRWVSMPACERREGLIERCNEETVRAAVAEFGNVTVVSAEVVPADAKKPEHFHVVLNESAYGVDNVTINVWCPLDWNGRFMACVGGGLRTFHIYEVLGAQNRIAMPSNVLSNGFATANTDGGVPGEAFTWGLKEKGGAVDYERILNFAYRSTHSMTVIAKKVITAVYGVAPEYSYIQGASGGGRQTLREAQLYPGDYDGYWAVDPAINWAGLFTSFVWPVAVMNEENHIITPAKLAFFRTAAINETGGKYDFIETADVPVFDPFKYVGEQTEDGAITEADARVMKLIFDGPRTRGGRFLWYGFRPGTQFWSNGVVGEPGSVYYEKTENGYIPQINVLGNSYVGTWLERDVDWDGSKIGYAEFEALFERSLTEMQCLECNNPDLYELSKNGGKLIMSHAVNDDTIPSDGTLDYYKRVVERMGGEENTTNFFRMLLSPGGGHTTLKQPGLSFTLADGMIALMKWVEDGIAPEVIPALQYDFEQNEAVLTGDVAVYKLGQSNPGLNIRETAAYAKMKQAETVLTDGKFNINSAIAEIMADERGLAILRDSIGVLLDMPMMEQAKGMSIGALRKMIPEQSIKEKIGMAIVHLSALR